MTDAVPHRGGPLQGIRIIDLTAVIMGPYAMQIMADLGADVIKVEAPDGDIMRYVGKHGTEGMGPIHLTLNRGKSMMTLDLKKREARDVLMKLVGGADAFVHAMRPKAIERLGFGYEAVRAVNPNIVYCGAYGYGAEGPYADDPAYDDLIQGLSGIADLAAHMVGEPRFFSTLVADKVCGLTLAYAMLAALIHRLRTGEGQKVEVPMLESMVQFVMVEHLGDRTFGVDEPIGYARALSQLRKPHRTKDGYVCALPYHDKNWRDFFMIVERPDLATDSRFNSHSARSENYEVLYKMLGDFIAEKPSAFWLETLRAASIPVAPVSTLKDLFNDPHLKAVDLFQAVKHPTMGDITAIRSPIGFSATPASMGKPAERMGTDNVAVLERFGYSQAEIDRLIDMKAVIQG